MPAKQSKAQMRNDRASFWHDFSFGTDTGRAWQALKAACLSVAAFILLLLNILTVGPAIAKTVNPFEEGVKVTELTQAQRQDLMQYIQNSKEELTSALEDAKGKDLDTVYGLYEQALKNVVINSYASAGRRELLLRIALNEALQLTVGVPTADGCGIKVPGILKGKVSKGLITAIFEDSIHLALQYYSRDHEGVEQGNLVELPYVGFAEQRLELASHWLGGIFDDATLLLAQKTLLENWHSTVARGDNLKIRILAANVFKVENALSTVSSSRYSTGQAVRYLRGIIFKLEEDSPGECRIVSDSKLGLILMNGRRKVLKACAVLPTRGSSSPGFYVAACNSDSAILPRLKDLLSSHSCWIRTSKCTVKTEGRYASVYRDDGEVSLGWSRGSYPKMNHPNWGYEAPLKALQDIGYCSK